jgi:hypothetical protein
MIIFYKMRDFLRSDWKFQKLCVFRDSTGTDDFGPAIYLILIPGQSADIYTKRK